MEFKERKNRSCGCGDSRGVLRTAAIGYKQSRCRPGKAAGRLAAEELRAAEQLMSIWDKEKNETQKGRKKSRTGEDGELKLQKDGSLCNAVKEEKVQVPVTRSSKSLSGLQGQRAQVLG